MQIWVNIWVWFSVSIMKSQQESYWGHICAESFLSDSYFVANSQQLKY